VSQSQFPHSFDNLIKMWLSHQNTSRKQSQISSQSSRSSISINQETQNTATDDESNNNNTKLHGKFGK
jgi:hypothetical protein